ncbi:hypothetical protein JCM21531_3517 [Acetivibrio straminisolvens JCM 21531]|uniref:Uncharacterized protein n=1 Tax=Acetivibrio straminisolvens JCM 21531 TaxID=1294263 RepID=W4VAY2_9FIRM|nr:hypothetical protein JCM21531_3517 [Acetivibrio straminisolvens JCM 21531]
MNMYHLFTERNRVNDYENIRAAFKDVKKIHNVVQTTIKVYPKYYPEGVVDFWNSIRWRILKKLLMRNFFW